MLVSATGHVIEAGDVEHLYLDVIATMESKPQAEDFKKMRQSMPKSVLDKETTLEFIILCPAYKDANTNSYLSNAKPPVNATTVTIPAQGKGKHQVPEGELLCCIKNAAHKSNLFNSKDGNLVGEQSNIFMQETLGQKTVTPLSRAFASSKFWMV